MLCKGGCGRPVKATTGYKPAQWCGDDACRMRATRAKARSAAKPGARVPVESLHIVEGDVTLVSRVRALVATLDATDEVALAQAALVLQLAQLAAQGSVSAARELRLALLELRLASDPSFEPEPSQAMCLKILIESIRGGPVEGPPYAGSGEGTLDRPTPPGWVSTAESGEILLWLGRRWMALRDADDVDGLTDLERWIGSHSSELHSLRTIGRWAAWPDVRDSL